MLFYILAQICLVFTYTKNSKEKRGQRGGDKKVKKFEPSRAKYVAT